MPGNIRREPTATAGQVLGTSSVVAGHVQSATTPGPNAAIGRAIEATGATTSGFVLVSVDVG
jgi:hypothetical protein